MRSGVLAVALAACGSDGPTNGDVVGPFTGPTYRYVVDDLQLPLMSTVVKDFSCNLDGDGALDNQLGQAVAFQAGEGNITTFVSDLIGSGQLASIVEIQANNLTNDRTVGVRYLGYDGAPSVVMGGKLENGAFVSNRTRTTKVPGSGVVRLPVFIDADVSQFQVQAMQIDLVPDGAGGFDGLVCGGVVEQQALDDAARGLVQMLLANPADHPYAITLLDADKSGLISEGEVLQSSIVTSLLTADFEYGGDELLSMGFRVHLSPCEGGVCPQPPAPTNGCRDRVMDGDEADIDCGGAACAPCPGGSLCRGPADCYSNICASGLCAHPTCADGAWDGFETDVDCGWHCPAKCTQGQMCERGTDCVSGMCGSTSERCL